jgi:metal iron transporter
MNQTSRTDETLDNPGWNQSPPSFNADETTRQDFNGIVNLREQRDHLSQSSGPGDGLSHEDTVPIDREQAEPSVQAKGDGLNGTACVADRQQDQYKALTFQFPIPRYLRPLVKFASFVGPGFLIAVAYIDPGNYATDVAAGAQSRYALLFVVLMSNLFAVFLQSLCIKLGSVTGLNLAENCRAHLPKWLTVCLYVLAESAIIATDIAEVRHV